MLRNEKFALFIIAICTLIVFLYLTMDSNVVDMHSPMETFSKQHRLLLVKVQQHLATAHRSCRSSKTMNEIAQAFRLLDKVILDSSTDKVQLKSQEHYISNSTSKDDLIDVCPEIRLHKQSDYPLYNTPLKTANCTNSKPFNTVVGIAIMSSNCSTARSILNGIRQIYPNLHTAIGIKSSEHCDLKNTHYSTLAFFKSHNVSTGLNGTGANWKTLINKLSTKYVLISRDLYIFDNQSSLERLVRVISETGIDAVGGPQRFEDGRWVSGCYQMAMRNYTLRLIEGHDLSYKSCMYCDYLSTAFLSRRSTLLDILSDHMKDSAVFIDFFLQLFKKDQIGGMMCADVMFSSDYQDINDQARPIWQQIAINYKLNRIVLPNNRDIWFECMESKVRCSKRKGQVVPPCCLKELKEAFLTMMRICNDRNLNCTIISGGTIGAMKFYDVLPWERDEDMDFHAKGMKAFGEDLKKKGYGVELKYYHKPKKKYEHCLKTNFKCMYFALRTKNWRIEMYGGGWIVSDKRGNYREPTKILFNGMWLNTFTNPGRYGRVKYGDDFFKHVEHWSDRGYSSGWSNYSETDTGVWLNCGKEHFHGCLSNWLPTGNMQFKDIWI